MIELSRYNFEALRQDGEFILYRGRRGDNSSQILVLSPTAQRSSPECLKRLEYEYALKEELDPKWAIRPIAIAHYWGRTVLILDYPGGVPLDQLLGQPSDVTFSLRLAISLSTAIDHLHRRGLIHKDIKPANVVTNSVTGHCWLMGFGIASRLPRERQSLEAPEFVAGTLAYMAPEQTGRMNRSIDARSDLYALGVTLYEMFTGVLPFTASDPMEWVHCHIARQPVAPRERVKQIPESISAIIMKLLAKTAEERYQTAAGVEADLRRCLAGWESTGQIGSFALGAHDASGQLQIPEKLYGRDRDCEEILRAFDRVAATGRPELLLVSGYSGIGKSSVVNELHKSLVPLRGLFATGKCDQYERDVPYATLTKAFQTLVRQILAKTDAEIIRWRDSLREVLGLNGELIVNLIPELELIIGKQPPVPSLAPQDQQNRFQMVFRRFLMEFARAEHPLALFLDDLQWLDSATLELLKYLITEADVRHLLLLGAYRDNEVSPSHPLAQMLNEIRAAGTAVREIILKPLSMEDIHRLVVDALQSEPGRAESLAQLIYQKTGGNPLFTNQFLAALAEENLLALDSTARAWNWNLNGIHAKGFADNVGDLMAEKLGRLSDTAQEALRQLACLGNSAKIAALNMVRGDSEEALHAVLLEAFRAGLVFRLDGAYAFIHDRAREAAYSLIPEDMRAELHLRIGRSLITKMTQNEIDGNIFDVVNQIDSGAALISDPNEKDLVAELNLRAGKKAKASAAYASACIYLSAGMGLAGFDAWERKYELAFGLWLERAESEYLNSNFDEAEQLITELLSRARSKVDKVAAFRLRILLHLIKAEYRQAIGRGLECLHLFNIEMPSHPTREDVRLECQKIYQTLGNRSIESLIDLPSMTDPEMRAAMDILSVIAAAAFNTDINLMYLFFCQMVNASLKYGTTGASTHGYGEFATILGPVFHRYLDGYRFGKLACDLIERYGFDTYKTKVYFCMQRPMLWTQPIESAIDFIRRAIDAGVETHDMVFACFSWHHLVTGLLLRGVRLDEVWRESENGIEFVRRVKFRSEDGIVRCQQRFIRTLLDEATVTAGTGAQFTDESFETELAAARRPFEVFHYWTLKLQTQYLFADYDTAILAAKRAKALLGWAEQHIQSLIIFISARSPPRRSTKLPRRRVASDCSN